ncbi:MAG: hypothetical protein HYT80_10085 [Euryarchaeota archaeon]|nr:hypothetical protein [Euryarchaeota archaeon]
MFRAADVVVFPYRNFFGASASLAMALAYGKPVLLSTGAFPDWVKRGLPHCAPTAAALRESILRLASGTELDAAAALSRRYRAKFTWEFSAQETRLLYNWLSREGPQRLSLPAAT